jgi:hypothetical protein
LPQPAQAGGACAHTVLACPKCKKERLAASPS